MNHKSERGYSLIGVLLIITIVAIVGVSLAGITLQSVKISTKERDNQAVYYIAEAGMEYVIHQLKTKVKDISETSPSLSEKDLIGKVFENDETYVYEDNKHMITYRDFEAIEGKGTPEASITFAVNENPSENPEENTTPYEIISVGEVGSEKRAVGTTFWIERQEASEPGEEAPPSGGGTGEGLPRYAIFAEDDIEINGAIQVYDVDPPHTKETIVGIKNKDSEFNIGGTTNLEKPATKLMPELPPFIIPSENDLSNVNVINDKLLIEENSKMNILNVNDSLNIDVYGVQKLVVDRLEFNSDASFQINKKTEDAELHLYVRDKITFSGTNKMNNAYGQESSLYLFYSGEGELVLKDFQLFGSIYIKNAPLKILTGTKIQGNLFSGGEVIDLPYTITNPRIPLLLAPKAVFSFNGTIEPYGMIIVKSIEQGSFGTFKLYFQDCSKEEYNSGKLATGHLRTNYCPNPKIEGPISIKAVDDYNSGGSSNNGNNDGENDNGGNNGSESSESSSINNIGKVKEVPLN